MLWRIGLSALAWSACVWPIIFVSIISWLDIVVGDNRAEREGGEHSKVFDFLLYTQFSTHLGFLWGRSTSPLPPACRNG